ncbi:MAG: spermidine synthase [Candidatus Brockarchaeota archaeon]|nr:spermidine synthase [Candidatus Brockarchaeota archaeon]
MSRLTRTRYLTFDLFNNYFLFRVSKILLAERTRFQTLEVLESPEFGLCLLLDGLIQVAEYDEYRYHETLVHTPLLNAEDRRRIAILGGGDGCALREVLKYREVEHVDLVDIDGRVVEVSEKYLQRLNKGSLKSRRVKIHLTDARKFISRKKNYYDSIIIDLTDPVEGGPSVLLYSKEFYRMVQDALKPGGTFITQATAFQSRQFRRIFWTVKRVFVNTIPLHVYVKSFCDDWGFVMGLKPWDGLRILPEEFKEVDNRIAEKVKGRLRYLNGKTYLANFFISPEEEEILMKPAKEITDREALKNMVKEEDSYRWVF